TAMDAYEGFLDGRFDKMIDLYRKAVGIREQGEGSLRQHLIDEGIHTGYHPDGKMISDADAMDHYLAHHQIEPKKSNGTNYGFNSHAVMKVLAHTWEDMVEGPKTPQFSANLSGRDDNATIDRWAGRTGRRLLYEGHMPEGVPWRLQTRGEEGLNDVDF